jgi:hypothetical protein
MNKKIWLAADYHLPIMYSCRMPVSSPQSAQCTPVPGPATVRLALIRAAIELYGVAQTRDLLFPIIRNSDVAIRPPAKIGISPHLLRLYKANAAGSLQESIGYREFAHAEGVLTVYLTVPAEYQAVFTDLLCAVGYWGQGSSVVTCLRVITAAPLCGEIIRPLSEMSAYPLGQYASIFLTDWITENASWTAVTQANGKTLPSFTTPALFILPLQICERQSAGFRFERCSLEV